MPPDSSPPDEQPDIIQDDPTYLAGQVERLGLAKIERHIFLCAQQSTPKCCSFEDSTKSWVYLKKRIGELGLTDVRTIRPLPAHERDFDPDGTLHGTHPEVCCFFRKVVPLRKALNPFSAWISGRKRHHGAERSELPTLERDGRHIKINPLVDWDGDALEAYRLEHDLPAHPLVAEGYASIGCRPCTTPVAPGEDPRAGRWRGRDKTECGIHFVDGKAVRSAA